MMNNDIKLSAEFKTQTTKAIFSIVFFTFTYIILLLLAVAVTCLCIYGGVMIIAIRPMILTIALGVGLASMGVLILIFLLKFIFKSHHVDRSHLYEITKEKEPALFALIDEIVKKVGTPFPKKVYLSADVNAAVFYDSSFWSMFFPVQKNLQIGLGLVNSVTQAEFKAILAHEFGHFSQRTMKVGSYVYNVNQMIFNLVNDNESYDKLIQNWANVSGYISIFVAMAVRIVQGIQKLLIVLYGLVNKSYMAMSREMEFHADEVAAHITGFEPLKTSLLRMAFADHSFNSVLNFYSGKISDNLKSENIYNEHAFTMSFIAETSNIPLSNNLPTITVEELNKFNKSKLVIKDQWASHPSTEERIERLEKLNIASEQLIQRPANEIFSNIELTQKELTGMVFKNITYQGLIMSIPLDEFKNQFKKEFLNNSFSTIYHGYYDHKNPIPFEINTSNLIEEKIHIEELFSDKKNELVYTVIALQNDIEMLKQIADNKIPLKTFDYDGIKYKRKQSPELLSKLTIELEQYNKQIKRNDIRIFQFFYKLEQRLNVNVQLERIYKEFFDFDKKFDPKYEIYTKLSQELQFVSYTTTFDQIHANFVQLEPLEADLKNGIKELMEDSIYKDEISTEIKDNFELYLSKEWKYFGGENYNDRNLQILFGAMNNYAFILSRGYFLLKKKLLMYQAELMASASQH